MPDDPILAALGRVEAGQAVLENTVLIEADKARGELMAPIDRLQDALTAIRDDVGVGMGGVNAARKANDNTRDDVTQLRDAVSVMYRRMLKIEEELREIRGEP